MIISLCEPELQATVSRSLPLRRPTPSTPCADVPNAICSLKPSRATVFSWLCDQCSSRCSLKLNFHDGISLVPLTTPKKRSTAPMIAVGDITSDIH
jgi:hypothetical protein